MTKTIIMKIIFSLILIHSIIILNAQTENSFINFGQENKSSSIWGTIIDSRGNNIVLTNVAGDYILASFDSEYQPNWAKRICDTTNI